MFGAMEALSHEAVATLLAGKARCVSELQWQSWGEDLFVANCLEHLGVTGQKGLDVRWYGTACGVIVVHVKYFVLRGEYSAWAASACTTLWTKP